MTTLNTVATMASMTRVQLEEELAAARAGLDAWLDARFPEGEPRNYNGEIEAGYPEWGRIEAIAGRMYEGDHLRELSPASVKNLMFCISRADELNSFLNWMSPDQNVLSNIGALSEADFLRLCDMSLSLPEDASDWQLAACFENIENVRGEHVEILLRFFARTNIYTKRRVLHSLVHLKYDRVATLVDKLWQEDCEFAKLSCLHVLKQTSPESPRFFQLLEEYQRLYDVDQKDYRKSHMEQLLA